MDGIAKTLFHLQPGKIKRSNRVAIAALSLWK